MAIPFANPDWSENKGKKYIYIQNIAKLSTCLPTWIIITVRKSLNSCIWHYRTTTKSSKIAFLRHLLISEIIFNKKSEHLTPLQSFRNKWSHIYFPCAFQPSKSGCFHNDDSWPTIYMKLITEYLSQQNMCITFLQCWTNVENVGPSLYKCYRYVLCLLGWASMNLNNKDLGSWEVMHIPIICI